MRNHRFDDRETILPPIDLSRLRGHARRNAFAGPAGGGLSNQMLRFLFFWFSPWLLRAGVAAIAITALWNWLPNATTLVRLAGAGFNAPLQAADWIEWSKVRLEGFTDATGQGVRDRGAPDGGPTAVTPLVVRTPDEATAR